MVLQLINLQPGQLYEEDCKKCQCIDNSFTCHEEACETEIAPITYPPMLEVPRILETLPPILIPPKTTPPPKCDENRYVQVTYTVN